MEAPLSYSDEDGGFRPSSEGLHHRITANLARLVAVIFCASLELNKYYEIKEAPTSGRASIS
jgi:hypothetical protein